MFIFGIIVTISCAIIERKRVIFVAGGKLKISNKENYNISLFDHIFSSPKGISEIHVYTIDGAVYRGLCREDKGWDILCGTHPYSGDIVFTCDWYKKADWKKGKTVTYI